MAWSSGTRTRKLTTADDRPVPAGPSSTAAVIRELIAPDEGPRESAEFPDDLLRDCRRRGMRDPEPVVAHAATARGRRWNGHSRLISAPDPQDLTIALERQVSALVIFRKAWKSLAALTAAAVVVAGGLTATASVAQAASNPSTPPVMTLGTYQTSEDSSQTFNPIADSGHPNVANTYLSWGQGLPTTFMSSAYSQGATPYLEIEPWEQGPSWNAVPSFSAIASNGDASDTNCAPDGSTYSTSCATWLADLGQAIASYGHPVVLTFAHEFNVGGQYPWAVGYAACKANDANNGDQCPAPGSCGTTDCTASQWIAAWDEVQSIVDENAGGNAFWMWAPNADTGGTPDTGGTTDPSPYWPGASHVDLVGVDGYPDTTYGSQFGTFSGEFGQTFSEIRDLGYTGGIFISETNLAPLSSSGYETVPQFISDLCAAGGTGFLEWEDEGAPEMTSTQWSEADTALSSDCAGGSTPPTQAPAVVTGSASGVTSTSATLNGTVNPEGAATTYQFQYGTSTGYGTATPASPASAGSGSIVVSESASVSGLSASTTYDYRLVATNAAGTTDGSNQTFTTPAASSSGNAFTPVGGLIQGTSLTPSVTAHAAGDVILLHVTTEGSAPPTGISGGDATWKQVGSTVRGSVNSGLSAAVYEGTVTTAGTAQATVTTSGTPSAVRIAGQEYNPGSGQTGVLVSQANLDVTGTNTGPSITPTGSNELYSFYGFDTDIGSAGSTTGYTYEVDNNGNIYAYDPASPTQPPVFSDSDVAFGIAVLMESAPTGSS
jgi:hypothetical protein